MRSLSGFIILLLISFAGNAQRFVLMQGGAALKNYYGEIPYEVVNGALIVYPEINGKKMRFLFDTGAPVQISPELFKDLKLPVIQSLPIIDANGSTDSLNVVYLPNISLNNIPFINMPALVVGADFYKCWQVDGVIGSNLLRNSIVRIDAHRHVIILTDNEKSLSLNKKLRATLLTDNTQSYPYMVVWLSGKNTFLAGFDTGDSDFLVLTEKDMNRFSKINAFEKLSAGYGSGHRSIFGLQKFDSTYRLKFPSIRIGGQEFSNVRTETNKTDQTRLGAKLLDHGVVTLDFIHHYFYFEPDSDKIDLDEKDWPLQPIMATDKLVVGVVWQNLKEQVKPGEQILAVDDVSYEHVTLCDLQTRRSSILKDKQTAVLTIKGADGAVRKVTIAKE